MAVAGELRRRRTALGISQVELARRTRISRQALGAIESGVYQPNVTVALSLARELNETVESLFGDNEALGSKQISAMWPRSAPLPGRNSPVRVALARIAGKTVAVPQPSPRLSLAPMAGTAARVGRARAAISTYWPQAEIDSTLIIAGCDPAVSILADWMVRRRSPVVAVAQRCSSTAALAALLDGAAHIAGVHLRDNQSGEYNLKPVRRAVGRRRTLLINFARWELGLAVAPGNPLKLTGLADLARPRLCIVNREEGSGARAALDAGLSQLGINGRNIIGYQRELLGHLEVAAAIAAGEADAGLTIHLAAQASSLRFIPLQEERYDLVMFEDECDLIPVKSMLDALNSARFAREVNQLCAYATDQMGQVLAHIR
jgi:molybdate-binding protein/DNA-binding XRE family transcriptional regulator